MTAPADAEKTLPVFDWEAATPRERDAWVAENVMGYDMANPPIIPVFDFTGRPFRELIDDWWPTFTTDPSADYAVLKHVRETWGKVELYLFDNAVLGLLGKPLGPYLSRPTYYVHYTPGVWSHAAYLTLTSEPARAEA